jgi:hypothetical protein
MQWLAPGFISSLTPGALLLVAVLFIMTGRLVPKSVLKQVRDDRDERVKEAAAQTAEWREAHRLSELARETNAETFREALEVARTANAALTGFREAVTRVAADEQGRG